MFLHESLSAVTDTLEISRNAGTLIQQNFALAIGYNAIAVPIAVFGYVTPLVAAAAMSLSSVIVVANAMRLGQARSKIRPATTPPPPTRTFSQWARDHELPGFFLCPSRSYWVLQDLPLSYGRCGLDNMKTSMERWNGSFWTTIASDRNGWSTAHSCGASSSPRDTVLRRFILLSSRRFFAAV